MDWKTFTGQLAVAHVKKKNRKMQVIFSNLCDLENRIPDSCRDMLRTNASGQEWMITERRIAAFPSGLVGEGNAYCGWYWAACPLLCLRVLRVTVKTGYMVRTLCLLLGMFILNLIRILCLLLSWSSTCCVHVHYVYLVRFVIVTYFLLPISPLFLELQITPWVLCPYRCFN